MLRLEGMSHGLRFGQLTRSWWRRGCWDCGLEIDWHKADEEERGGSGVDVGDARDRMRSNDESWADETI